MEADRDRNEVLWEQLHGLLELPVVPRFSREFYGLIVQWATRTEQAEPAQWTRRLLEIEMRYYRHLQRLEEGEPPPTSLLEKRQIALELLLEHVADSAGALDRPGEVARRLILAECCYFLERPGDVVAHLEAALEAGGSDALISFALGHARFLLALRSFVHLQLPNAELVVADQGSLQSLCLAAVHAFEGALTGGPRDPEVLWWIGRVLLAAGFRDQAEEILAQVEMPEGEVQPAPLASEALEFRRAPGLPATIDEAEVARFLEGVRGSHPLSHLL